MWALHTGVGTWEFSDRDFDPRPYDWDGHYAKKVTYNPYAGSAFTVDGGIPVDHATMIHLSDDGKAYGYGVIE